MKVPYVFNKKPHIAELKALLKSEAAARQIDLELKGLTLVDRDAVSFSAAVKPTVSSSRIVRLISASGSRESSAKTKASVCERQTDSGLLAIHVQSCGSASPLSDRHASESATRGDVHKFGQSPQKDHQDSISSCNANKLWSLRWSRIGRAFRSKFRRSYKCIRML
jgi:hypothetical protein